MKFAKDGFVQWLILYAISLAWFGGIGNLIIESSEHILTKIFFIGGLLVIALYLFTKFHKSD